MAFVLLIIIIICCINFLFTHLNKKNLCKIFLLLIFTLSFSFASSDDFINKETNTPREIKYAAEIQLAQKNNDKFRILLPHEQKHSHRRKTKIFTLKNYLTFLLTCIVIFLGIIAYFLFSLVKRKNKYQKN